MSKFGGVKIRLQEKRLLSNTIFLYLLTFSTQLFSFLTVPYLTRVLGPTVYGKVGIALAYMSYVQIIMDFGFILSATQKVVECGQDTVSLGKLVSAVTIAKCGLGLLLSGIFGTYVYFSADMRQDFGFYLLYALSYIANALMPDFFYRGIEKMKTITIRTFCVKGGCTLLTFLFIKNQQDYWMIPLFALLGNVLAALVMYIEMGRKYSVYFRKVEAKYVVSLLKNTAPFFVSRIASTAYQAMNTIILSFMYGMSPLIGCYTSADKVISLGKTASGPIADSLYPYMLKERNFKLVKKMLAIFMPIILLGATVLFIFAEPLCIWLFGAEYADAGLILRCMLPILVVILPTYVLCFPVMVPMGLSKWANSSNVLGMVCQLLGILLLWVTNSLNVISLCILSSVSEVLVFAYRAIVVWCHRSKMKEA